MQPLVLLDTVGLCKQYLPLAPRLHALEKAGWSRPLGEIVPAVTCSAQATMLTGRTPQEHGIVGNGWLYRDTMEIRFWQQSNRLLQAEPIYSRLKREAAERGKTFRCAKIFWWFNQGADVEISVTPKPHYGADGNKAFGVLAYPEGLGERLRQRVGAFPFQSFWGPMSGLPSSTWIANCAADIVRQDRPDLTLVYLPHLDYQTQQLGPEGCDWAKLCGELDQACAPLLDAAREIGARVWVVNEYTHLQVSRPVLLNRILRQAGLLVARPGPFGETLDTFAGKALAVCDHQVAHVYVKDASDMARVREVIGGTAGIERIYAGEERAEIGLNHPRAGDLVVIAQANAWFAYPFWLDDRQAPDYARTVDIHRKPGYDPCELFLDPKLLWPKGRVIRRLVQKKLGFRTLFDVIPLDPSLVKGSHGIPIHDPAYQPLLIADGPAPTDEVVPQARVYNLLGEAFCSR